MPLYDYKCKECNGEFELYTTLDRWNDTIPCSECGGECERVIVKRGHGGVLRDDPVWLDNGVRAMLQDLDDPSTKPIQTRQEWKKYLKDNGIAEKG